MKSAFVLTENLDRLPLEVRRMIWGHLADMIEDHHGYRSINRGALQLSLGKFVVYTSELLLRHELFSPWIQSPAISGVTKEYWPASTSGGRF